MMSEQYIDIKISNCNNIREGRIKLEKNKLNIKYAMNGTGKSSLSKALKLKSEGKNLNELTPFSKIGNPSIELSSTINRVLLFDEEFVNSIVFNDDQVIKNSFEVFIKTDDYDRRRDELNKVLNDLKVDINQDKDIDEMMQSFLDISKKLVQNNDGRLKLNNFLKAITKKENLYNVPNELIKYKDFIQDDSCNIEWIDWKNKGFEFDKKHICPFCSDVFKEDYTEEKEIFKNSYDKNNSKHLKDMLTYLKKLKKFINADKYKSLDILIRNVDDEDTLKVELKNFITEINYIKNKMILIKEFDSYKIKNEEISKLEGKIKGLEINNPVLNIFNSSEMLEIIENINAKIMNLITKVESLKKDVGKLNGYIQAAVNNSKRDINSFLESAGINYEIDILVENENDAKTILKYRGKESSYDVDNIKKHLSWGEKNAFAMVLFMYYALKQEAECIILDDPISSFDSNKKYAIINRLFKNPNGKNILSLYKKTVLMLTHDFEPVIDFIVNHKPTGGFVNANYLKNNEGILNEIEINENEDIQPIMSMLYNNSRNRDLNNIHRIIFLRKYIEYMQLGHDPQIAYDILSSLIHGKTKPDKKISNDKYEEFDKEELEHGMSFIYKFIEDFDYERILKEDYSSEALLKNYEDEDNNYLKLQIFRAYLEVKDIRNKINDDVVLKFVDDIYHIENDFTYCLDFMKYDIVPNYIIKRINEFMEKERSV